MTKGKLYLIPCGLGGENEMSILPAQTIEITHDLDEFIVEKEKTARHFLKRIEYPKPLNDLILHPLNKRTRVEELIGYLKSCLAGKNVGIISEAGCPAIADPGASMVELAHEAGIQVIPLTGPSSILMALMASGMSGQSFIFHGYIPKDKSERIKFIRQMERDAKNKRQSQIFMETPFRNHQILEEVLSTCNPNTKLCVASNISVSNERIATKTIQAWKKTKIDLHKKPSIFVIG
ncbi:MAG: SAM-dependent methyltransferase [Crocinitomicaceae bacterium]|nr:SAM-dependent methyltransferase [Crocinitomicaceae bacterium]|tara:strand:+ start:11869 stop:12573 length:705 start_codon:yes stop_codon:yes gene_type:complete